MTLDNQATTVVLEAIAPSSLLPPFFPYYDDVDAAAPVRVVTLSEERFESMGRPPWIRVTVEPSTRPPRPAQKEREAPTAHREETA